MKSSSNVLKAARIIAKLTRIYRPAMFLSTDDILNKIQSKEELDFYYTILCVRSGAK